jgi:hypothetical protein
MTSVFHVNLIDFNKKINFFLLLLCCSFFPSLISQIWTGERSCSTVWSSPFCLLLLLRSRLAPDFLAQQISSPAVFLSRSHFLVVDRDPFSSVRSLPVCSPVSVSAESRADPVPGSVQRA